MVEPFAQSDQSLLCALWIAKDPRFLHADNEDSDQTGWMPRLIWVFIGHIGHFVGFFMHKLKWYMTWAASWQNLFMLNELRHDKTNKMSVRPAWSESSLSAWRELGSLATHWVQAKSLIKLSRCPGWSESSLSAQSFCWSFEAAHIRQSACAFWSVPLYKCHAISKKKTWSLPRSVKCL